MNFNDLKVYSLSSLFDRPAESQPAVPDGDPEGCPGREGAAQDVRRQRILNLLLDGPLQRPGAVNRVETRLAQQVARTVFEHDVQIAFLQTLAQVHQLDVDDLADLLGAQRMEHDNVIDPVDELRSERLLHDFHDRGAHARVILLPRVLLDDL